MNVRREVRSRAQRVGLGDAANCDPWAHASLRLLEEWCDHLAMALEDEGVDPELADRIIVRTITGSLPSPTDAMLRMEVRSQRIADLRLIPPTTAHQA